MARALYVALIDWEILKENWKHYCIGQHSLEGCELGSNWDTMESPMALENSDKFTLVPYKSKQRQPLEIFDPTCMIPAM